MPTGIGGELIWLCPSLDDSGNGTTTLNDLSGNGRNGTLTNFALSGTSSNWVADTASSGVRAIDHDGVNDYIATTVNGVGALVGNDAYTISIWGKLNTTSGRQVFAADWNSSAISESVAIEYSGAVYRTYNRTPLNTQDGGSGTTSWVHLLLAVCVGLPSKFYVNGSLVSTAGANTTSIPSGTKLAIGRGGDWNAVYLNGRWDDFRIIDRVVTSPEVSQLSSRRAWQPISGDFEHGMFGGMSGAMTGGMAS